MKKIFTVLTILMISVAAFAQTDPRINEGSSVLFDGFEKVQRRLVTGGFSQSDDGRSGRQSQIGDAAARVCDGKGPQGRRRL